MKRSLPFALLRASLLPRLLRETRQRRRVTVLLYHAPSAAALDANLAALTRRYRFLPLREFLDAHAAGELSRLPAKAAVLTLDDGHASNRALLPVLAKHEVKATIFVCTAVVGTRRRFWFEDPAARRIGGGTLKRLTDAERLTRLAAEGFREDAEHAERQALTWEEMAEMREWVDFESHTRTHPILPRCADGKARDEIFGARADLIARGYSGAVFAYPNGDYAPRDAALAREAGYRAALTIDVGFNDAGTDPFLIRRIGIPDDASPTEAIVRASGLWSTIRVLLRGRYQTEAP